MRNRRRWLAAAALGALAALALACGGSSGPPLETVNGRTILMDSSDPAGAAPPSGRGARADEAPGEGATSSGGDSTSAGREAQAPPPQKPPRKKEPELITRADDARVGKENAVAAAAQMGLLGDPDLDAYVDEIGRKLLRGLPRRSFKYQFHVVDQWEPNAFALPGGYIFVSRGLIALANDEDELANVIGHEITHAANRHAARQQAAERHRSRLMMGYIRAADQAAYSRDMEREADEGGQILAASAGWDPHAMSTLQSSLGQFTTLLTGSQRRPSFFDTHPGTTERVTATALRASELRWTPGPSAGDSRARYLKRIDGVPVGDRPESGVFRGQRFLHPDMDFQILFPSGWHLQNSPQAVGALSPRRDGVIFLSAIGPEQDPRAAAESWVEQGRDAGAEFRMGGGQPLKIAGGDAFRVDAFVRQGRMGLDTTVTFFNYGGVAMMLTSQSIANTGDVRSRGVSALRSFRPLSPEQLRSFETRRLRVVTAKPGESLGDLVRRTGSIWNSTQAGVANAIPGNHVFDGGELVKIAKSEPYTPRALR